MIERCGDRQRKCDGLKKWPLHFFVESLPVMLQVALLLLASGLCRYMWSINSSVAFTLISLTGLGVAFYLGIVIVGMSSYACPFQTPASIALHGPWKKVRRRIVSLTVRPTQVLSRTRQMWDRVVRSLRRRQSLSTTTSLEDVEIHKSEPWMTPTDLAIIRRTNADDARCVSWILRNITDPEALDAAIRLAGTIRWFDDGINVDPPYDLVVSTFKACFDPTNRVYPGLRDRAYYSGRAMLWIHALAVCKSKEFGDTFPHLRTKYTALGLDYDIEHLLQVNQEASPWLSFELLEINREYTPSHLQWISNLLLHRTWAGGSNHGFLADYVPTEHKIKATLPLNATLNRLLVWCILLGSPVGEEALKIQDKSYATSSSCPSHH